MMEVISRFTAFILALALSPLLISIAICNFIIQGRPIIFRQRRIGKNFKPFLIYKFRTMQNDKLNNHSFQTGDKEKITKWGKFLRKTKLDELPQFFNVIKGDMRFIGPRPEVPEFVDKESFFFLDKIKPGLSGYSSILFRNESEIFSMIDSPDPYNNILKIKVALDKYYVNKKNFFEDLKLVGITILSLFIPKRMGHYLIIKLLKIQDNGELGIRDRIDDVKIKINKEKKSNEPTRRNFRILVLSDIISILSGFILAAFIRNDFLVPPILYSDNIYQILALLVIVKLTVYSMQGMFRGMWRYTSLVDMFNIIRANALSSMVIIALIGYLRGFHDIPRSIFLIDFIFTIGFTSISRIGIRLIYSHLINPKPYRLELNNRIMIIGAGTTGEFICKELLNDSIHRMSPIGFLDDNKSMHGKSIHGVKIKGKISDLPEFISDYDEAVICCPNAARKDVYRIIEICKKAGKPYRTLPSVNEVISGKLSINQLREVSIIDLLGRNEIEIDDESINKYIKGKRILITGAGGSIGSELVRQCLKYEPALLVMLDNSEYNLFNIEREIMHKKTNVLLKPLLSNIRDKEILSKIFSEYEPQVVFHAAAYKHVAMQEAFPWEAIKTNVHGTSNLVKLSIEHNTERFVLVSTDKAVKPINVMGATKRLAELICQGADSKFSTRFMAVRFGNVLGSSGSVIPIFQEQIKAGGPITITDPEMERYFMSVPEAAQLIIQAGSIGQGGEIFALDMGQPIKILDIANELIRLSGLEPDIDIPISFIGARPGEKQYEELSHDAEIVQKTLHDKIFEIRPTLRIKNIKEITEKIMAGELNGHEFNNDQLRETLSELVPEYKPLDKDTGSPVILNVKPEIEA
tara:strand:+ start:3229 stop:5814 length:2586 start_codon:yes stop_codon:yes gene_type:complete